MRTPIPKQRFIGPWAPLARDDLALLNTPGRSASAVQKIRASHHRVARLCAAGLKHTEIGAATGYSQTRITQLLDSPAMKELVAVYMEHLAERELETIDAYIQLKTQNMIAAERHISDHIAELDETGELLPVKTALLISADGADRLGYGKRQTNLNINADFASLLEKAIKRSSKASESKVIDVTPPPQKVLRRA